MKIHTSYSVKIKYYNRIFAETVRLYRAAVDFFIDVAIAEWNTLSLHDTSKERVNAIEKLTIQTRKRPNVTYDFGALYYKFPSYLRRAAIQESLGKVSSYMSNLDNWMRSSILMRGKKPSRPRAGRVSPAMYKDGSYVRIDNYTAKIKVFTRNTWDWLTVSLGKSDVDYILRHCTNRKECVPTLRNRGKEWFLDFSFEENVDLSDKSVSEQKILAVDLGLNNAATVSVMTFGGTVIGRKFMRLPREYDSLNHAINRIKKAQQHGARRTPGLWACAKGINDRIATLTADFLMETALQYGVDVIVFEYLNISRRKCGSKKQRLHLWRAQYVQSMVSDKAHRAGIRISRVNAWGTSRYAFDGSGKVLRGKESLETQGSYSLCKFTTGKLYNCDLNATYNIGARYFIREITKSLPVTERLALEAKVPPIARRSTCTWSDLIAAQRILHSSIPVNHLYFDELQGQAAMVG